MVSSDPFSKGSEEVLRWVSFRAKVGGWMIGCVRVRVFEEITF